LPYNNNPISIITQVIIGSSEGTKIHPIITNGIRQGIKHIPCIGQITVLETSITNAQIEANKASPA